MMDNRLKVRSYIFKLGALAQLLVNEGKSDEGAKVLDASRIMTEVYEKMTLDRNRRHESQGVL